MLQKVLRGALFGTFGAPECQNALCGALFEGCSFFAYSWKLPAYSGALLLTVDNFSFFAYKFGFFAYSFSFLTYSWSFFAYSGKVRLVRALRDCKQRSLTVSKKAPTVSKKASPLVEALRAHPRAQKHSSGHFSARVPGTPGNGGRDLGSCVFCLGVRRRGGFRKGCRCNSCLLSR